MIIIFNYDLFIDINWKIETIVNLEKRFIMEKELKLKKRNKKLNFNRDKFVEFFLKKRILKLVEMGNLLALIVE